ncbi:MAG: hypothetical protein JWS12_530 [Candidatus Saccharibacteria bacterium]|nr:hypothetical protein [Candidatus Saccharibacteria bacterium]
MHLPKPKLSRGRVVFGLIGFTVIIFAAVIVKQFSGPAIGTVNNNISTTNDTAQHLLHFDAKQASFDYQSDLKQQDNAKAQPNVLEYYIFNKGAGDHSAAAYLAVSIYALPSGNPDDNSGFHYRKQHPELYSSRVLAINTTNFVIVTKKDSHEIVAFSTHGTKLAAISLTAALATSSELQSRFDGVLNSWAWK